MNLNILTTYLEECFKMDEDFEYGGLFLAGIWRLLGRISKLRVRERTERV